MMTGKYYQKIKAARGFTLVEIVLVIILLGTISLVAMSRILSGNTFNPVIVRDQIVSVARSAQQNSLGRPGVTMTVTPSAGGDSVVLQTSDSGGAIETFNLSLDGVTLSGDINITDSCAVTPGASAITSATPMTITFAELGDLDSSGVTGSTGAVNSALRICIDNDALMSVCVSPSGFAYVGDCDV